MIRPPLRNTRYASFNATYSIKTVPTKKDSNVSIHDDDFVREISLSRRWPSREITNGCGGQLGWLNCIYWLNISRGLEWMKLTSLLVTLRNPNAMVYTSKLSSGKGKCSAFPSTNPTTSLRLELNCIGAR